MAKNTNSIDTLSGFVILIFTNLIVAALIPSVTDGFSRVIFYIGLAGVDIAGIAVLIRQIFK